MSWKQPDSDGGSIITSYTIEKRDKTYSRWTHVEKTSDDSTTITLKKLQTGSELMFRVSAVNKIGTSEPLEMSKYMTIKSPYGKQKNPFPHTANLRQRILQTSGKNCRKCFIIKKSCKHSDQKRK